MRYAVSRQKWNLREGGVLTFENEDLPSFLPLLGEHAIEYWLSVGRALWSHLSTLCCSGLRHTLR